MKELLSWMALPLVFIVACTESTRAQRQAPPHPTADPSEPCTCGADAAPQVWDGTGRSEAVRGT